MRLFKRKPVAPPLTEWLVEVEPGTWIVQWAEDGHAARRAVVAIAPYGSGPWTVLTRAEYEAQR